MKEAKECKGCHLVIFSDQQRSFQCSLGSYYPCHDSFRSRRRAAAKVGKAERAAKVAKEVRNLRASISLMTMGFGSHALEVQLEFFRVPEQHTLSDPYSRLDFFVRV